MQSKKLFMLLLTALAVGIAAAGCTPGGPCEITGNESLTIYRLPDPASDVFGILPAGESHEVLAYTASGFVGFDPGIAQAGNIGLAHHRWVLLNATLSPFCLAEVNQVTLAEVLADMPPTPVPPTPNPPPPPDPGAANLVITQVKLPEALLAVDTFGDVEVTVENQGDAPAAGYEVWLFPQFGYGPQNPAGHNAIPELAPGANQTIFLPDGIIYSSPGIFTMRALVTDDWLLEGDPTSTGTAGDLKDTEIRIVPGLCNPFADAVISVVTLHLPADTRVLPFYLKVEGGIEIDPTTLEASLGELKAYQCGLQGGFEDRIYCLVYVPEGQEGLAKQLMVRVKDCPEPAFVQNNILIPELLAGDDPGPSVPTCKADLIDPDCTAAGGQMSDSLNTARRCVCP